MKKNLITAFLMSVMITSANAAVINGINLGSGEVKMISSVFFNTTTMGGGLTLTRGVGEVQRITDGSNNILWQNDANKTSLRYVFEDIYTTSRININPCSFSPLTIYRNEGGTIDMFTDNYNFNFNGNFIKDSRKIRKGDRFLSGEGHPILGYTIIGLTNTFWNNGSGQFNAIKDSGPAYDSIVTNTIAHGDGTTSDFTFNYSTDVLNSSGYDFSGSSDISLIVKEEPTVEVSEPSMFSLFAIPLIVGAGLGIRRKKRNMNDEEC